MSFLLRGNYQFVVFNSEKLFLALYPSEDSVRIYQIEKTAEFDKWLRKLQDIRAKAIILVRLQKIERDGHVGDCQSVGNEFVSQ